MRPARVLAYEFEPFPEGVEAEVNSKTNEVEFTFDLDDVEMFYTNKAAELVIQLRSGGVIITRNLSEDVFSWMWAERTEIVDFTDLMSVVDASLGVCAVDAVKADAPCPDCQSTEKTAKDGKICCAVCGRAVRENHE